MKRPILVPALLLLAATPAALLAVPAWGAMGRAAAAPALDAQIRREVAGAFADAMRDRYIFPDMGARVAASIRSALAANRYEGLTDPAALAARLSADAAAIAHDKHLSIFSTTAPPPFHAPAERPQAEAGVVRADMLAGDIGYLEVVGFPPPGAFKRVLDRAMAGLANSRALVIDVRRNGGGSPEAVAYLVSFLVPPGTPINTIVSRVPATRQETRESYQAVPTPVSFAGTPVYVLTSGFTFSGGEEFAYDVQALKRGTIVGEVTGGGANPTGFVDLGHGMGAMIPFGRAVNAVTRSNWEGRGITPELGVPAGQALGAALAKAGQARVDSIDTASVRRVFTPRSTPLAGSEHALRTIIAGYRAGALDLSIMTAQAASEARQNLDEMRAQLAPLGDLRSLQFRGLGPFGGDEFALHFADGNRMMALVLAPDGKVASVSNLAPLPGAP